MSLLSAHIDEDLMRRALVQAAEAFEADEVPVGAVIAHKGRIIAQAHNQVEMLKDPTAHAEIIAIRKACKKLKNYRLNGCTMYVTIEPCAMCAGALIWARVNRIVFGAYDAKAGACGSVFNIVSEKKLNHQIEVYGGLLEEECATIIKEFFKSKR